MMNIGIDAHGGDTGTIEALKAVVALKDKSLDINYYLFGNEEEIIKGFEFLNYKINDKIKIIDAKEMISMNEHPVFALRTKPNSSIAQAGNYLKNNSIDAFISAGSTGALVALAQFYIKPIEGVDRPAVAVIIPTEKAPMLLIDSGCNVDSKPEWLYQYAILANIYYDIMFDVKKPTVGVLSVGAEENKGNALSLATYKLISENKNINFIGNVEARDVPYGICNILISDGFAGNVLLKTYEGVASFLLKSIKNGIKENPISMLGGLLIKPTLKKMLGKYDATVYGGAPILGTNKLILKCHGNAKCVEYTHTINQAIDLISKNIIEVIKDKYEV